MLDSGTLDGLAAINDRQLLKSVGSAPSEAHAPDAVDGGNEVC